MPCASERRPGWTAPGRALASERPVLPERRPPGSLVAQEGRDPLEPLRWSRPLPAVFWGGGVNVTCSGTDRSLLMQY